MAGSISDQAISLRLYLSFKTIIKINNKQDNPEADKIMHLERKLHSRVCDSYLQMKAHLYHDPPAGQIVKSSKHAYRMLNFRRKHKN